MNSLAVVVDFDGTLTQKDIGDEICDRFAPAEWRDIDAAWVRGELSLPEAQKRMWALARASEAEAMAYARQIGALRGGVDAFFQRVAEAGPQVVLASGGFDFYIRALLGERLARFDAAYFNHATFEADGRIAVSFPHADLACARCAVCKGNVCDRVKSAGAARVIFVGDGASDRCAIGRADEVCAVKGGLLARALSERGVAHRVFEHFDELRDLF